MKTLDEFNAGRRQRHAYFNENQNKPRKNGIACPKCGEELVDTNPCVTLSSNPPQKNVGCVKCGYQGFRVA